MEEGMGSVIAPVEEEGGRSKECRDQQQQQGMMDMDMDMDIDIDPDVNIDLDADPSTQHEGPRFVTSSSLTSLPSTTSGIASPTDLPRALVRPLHLGAEDLFSTPVDPSSQSHFHPFHPYNRDPDPGQSQFLGFSNLHPKEEDTQRRSDSKIVETISPRAYLESSPQANHLYTTASSPSKLPSPSSSKDSLHSTVPRDSIVCDTETHTHPHVGYTPFVNTAISEASPPRPHSKPQRLETSSLNLSKPVQHDPSQNHLNARPIPITASSPQPPRPDPLRILSTSSSASTASSTSSSLRSARRLNHSPYIVPQTARKIEAASPGHSMVSPATPMATVKDEPHTPVPLPLSPNPVGGVKQEPVELPGTPQRPAHSPQGSKIGSSPGSMSMSQRRGARPSFPLARVPSSRGSGSAGPSGRGLPTPQYSASSRQPPYPSHSPVPILTAPLSPKQGSRWNQSASSVPMLAPTPTTTSVRPPPQPNPYQVSLDEIPKDFVLKKLVQLASKYWYAPHSADCHIVVPLNRKSNQGVPSTPRTAIPPPFQSQGQSHQNGPRTAVPIHCQTSQPGSSFWQSAPPAMQQQSSFEFRSESGPNELMDAIKGSGPEKAQEDGDTKPDVLSSSTTACQSGVEASGRRGSLPYANLLEQCLVFPLHKDYLTTQSVLFRTLFNSPAAQLSSPTPRDETGRLIFQSPVIRGAKVLPTRADRPKALYVPLPDPASFGVILHWLYWHDAEHFNHCLSKGLVTWQGVIRNIEYLSLDNEIKLLAGKWWKRWVKPTEPTERRRGGPASLNGSKMIARKWKGRRRESESGLPMNRSALDEDGDEDEDVEDGDSDSGEEADDEDVEVDINHPTKGRTVEDGFADHVSARLGRL